MMKELILILSFQFQASVAGRQKGMGHFLKRKIKGVLALLRSK